MCFSDTKNFPDLVRYENGDSVAPRPGDILCLSGGKNKEGHVAIIIEVTSTYIKVAQQNTGINLGTELHAIGGELARNGNSIITPSGYTVQGWFRIPTYLNDLLNPPIPEYLK